MEPQQAVELFLLGATSGALGALLGIGGGAILVPGLALIEGIPFREAVAASLVCITATSVASSIIHLRQGRVNLRLAIDLEAFTVSGAIMGAVVAAMIPSGPLFLAFALLLLVSAWRMWPWHRPRPVRQQRRRVGLARAASVGAGLASSLLGVGGGVLKLPILNLLLGLDFSRSAATSIYMIGITASAGALIYAVRGDLDYQMTAMAVLGTMAGSLAASSVGHRIEVRWLKAAFAVVLIFIAYQMVQRGFTAL